MLFNSPAFIFFLVLAFSVYWLILGKSRRSQNVFLLLCSYFFYAYWDYRFLGLIALSSLIDYTAGQMIPRAKTRKGKKFWLWASIVFNIGMLGLFKYFNFFMDSFEALFQKIGFHADFPTLYLILPLGISFYTFQTMSYTIDVYREKIKPTSDPIAFFTYVSFFPQLFAGPIERAGHLVPQFGKDRNFELDAAKDGLRQILGGLFMKVVIADSCSPLVDTVYTNPSNMGTLTIGYFLFVLYPIQVYCDFAGYSNIAIGTARLFGFNLTQNFAFPYFAKNMTDFWRRWHITLLSWFTEYVYYPLGGSRVSVAKHAFNVFLIFLISGAWHGASWNFVIWGILHGIIMVLPVLEKRWNKTLYPKLRAPDWIMMLRVYFIFSVTGVLFRAVSIWTPVHIVKNFLTLPFDNPLNQLPKFGVEWYQVLFTAIIIFVFFWVEWKNKSFKHGLERVPSNIYIRWGIYLFLALMTVMHYDQGKTYIYYQF